MEAWSNGLLPSITRALGNARATCHRILSSIDLNLPREPPSPAALDRAGSVRARPYREAVFAVV